MIRIRPIGRLCATGADTKTCCGITDYDGAAAAVTAITVVQVATTFTKATTTATTVTAGSSISIVAADTGDGNAPAAASIWAAAGLICARIRVAAAAAATVISSRTR